MARKQINLRIEEDLCDFIDETFPSYGGRQWFFETCAERFRAKYAEEDITPPRDIISDVLEELASETANAAEAVEEG